MEKTLLLRLSLAYRKGKEIVKLEKERDLKARAFGICIIGLGQSLSTNPNSENFVNESSKKIYEGHNQDKQKIEGEIKENYSFPKNYLEKMIFNLGYSLNR